jgi:hypothetical protein
VETTDIKAKAIKIRLLALLEDDEAQLSTKGSTKSRVPESPVDHRLNLTQDPKAKDQTARIRL